MTTLQGKIALVTGATNGIGKVTALELAKLGAHVIIVGRNAAKTQATVDEIKAASGSIAVEMIVADLSLMSEVRRVAEAFKAKHDRLDILVNNAGSLFQTREESSEGLEQTFALNHMSYFLLTNLLLDVLKASGAARIVSVASEAERAGSVNFNDLQSKSGYSMGGFRAYGTSKLMNIMFTYELSKRLAGTKVTANVLHPGAVRTGFGSGSNSLLSVVFGLLRNFFLTPEQGADTSIYLASSPEVEGITGKYWTKRKQIKSIAASYNEADQRRLWEVSAALAKLS